LSAPLEAKREGNKRCNNIAQKSKQKKSNRFVYLLATPRRGSSTIDHPKNHANKFKKRKMRKLSDVKGLKKSRILSNNQRSEVYLSDRSAHVNRELITTGCYLIFYRKKRKQIEESQLVIAGSRNHIMEMMPPFCSLIFPFYLRHIG